MHQGRDTSSSRWAHSQTRPHPTPASAGHARAHETRPVGPSSSRRSVSSSALSITAQGGLRRARDDIGRKPEQLDMLLSPLLNPQVQEQFRHHIQTKLDKVEKQWPTQLLEPPSDKRKQELGIVLLDFRKLREGLTAARRQDTFAVEVYESSALCAIKAENWQQLASCLPHLVHVLHPLQATHERAYIKQDMSDVSSLTQSLASVQIDSSSRQPDRDRQLYFVSLYLLNIILHDPLPFPAYHDARQALSHVLDGPAHQSLHFKLVDYVYQALLELNYVRISRLLKLSDNQVADEWDQRDDSELPQPDEYQSRLLMSCLLTIRSHVVKVLSKAYKMKNDFAADSNWLERSLVLSGTTDAKDKQDWLNKVLRAP
ncbi:hypothetical protein OIV83_002852 [Microbotryomycetes sp. JL201]|nr:hypothetical protein OIV83_002852 [Microbotryomycetes sp. JL201]